MRTGAKLSNSDWRQLQTDLKVFPYSPTHREQSNCEFHKWTASAAYIHCSSFYLSGDFLWSDVSKDIESLSGFSHDQFGHLTEEPLDTRQNGDCLDKPLAFQSAAGIRILDYIQEKAWRLI